MKIPLNSSHFSVSGGGQVTAYINLHGAHGFSCGHAKSAY